MIKANSYLANPILVPNPKNSWEAAAVFNGSVIKEKNKYWMLYRALPKDSSISTIGIAESNDKFNFTKRKQLIKPEETWEKYGCEDPRITKIDGRYYIFYTAVSAHPADANSIKVAVAISDDLKTIKEKHLVTPFNAKAMALFPEKINGKYVAVLTVNTDRPPAKIAIAAFDKIEDIWSQDYWREWYKNLDENSLLISRITSDHVEVGAVPIKTKNGWLLVYAHIENYASVRDRRFGIEAILLDQNDPRKLLGRTLEPLLIPQEEYELEGMVPNVIFPSGALIDDKNLYIYYGAADTRCAMSTCNLEELLSEMIKLIHNVVKLKKYKNNPIIKPIKEHGWESKATFNPAVFNHDGKICIIYRAMSSDNTSSFGCAMSNDGFTITKRLEKPIYCPTYEFESKKKADANSGCEDPRITRLGNRLFMFYTAFDGISQPKIAMTSILVNDFINQRFNWQPPRIISNLYIENKDGCLLPEKINDKFVFFHRSGGKGIVLDFLDDLEFTGSNQLSGDVCIMARQSEWDSQKLGICTPPIKTDQGWLMFYHGVSRFDSHYRLGAMLLDLKNPAKVIGRSHFPLLEPEEDYEKFGVVNNVVFPCGAITKDDQVFVYYGAADTFVGVATGSIKEILGSLD